ncbi:unnamed protein product, partial [Urochloa humidicola]
AGHLLPPRYPLFGSSDAALPPNRRSPPRLAFPSPVPDGIWRYGHARLPVPGHGIWPPSSNHAPPCLPQTLAPAAPLPQTPREPPPPPPAAPLLVSPTSSLMSLCAAATRSDRPWWLPSARSGRSWPRFAVVGPGADLHPWGGGRTQQRRRPRRGRDDDVGALHDEGRLAPLLLPSLPLCCYHRQSRRPRRISDL